MKSSFLSQPLKHSVLDPHFFANLLKWTAKTEKAAELCPACRCSPRLQSPLLRLPAPACCAGASALSVAGEALRPPQTTILRLRRPCRRRGRRALATRRRMEFEVARRANLEAALEAAHAVDLAVDLAALHAEEG